MEERNTVVLFTLFPFPVVIAYLNNIKRSPLSDNHLSFVAPCTNIILIEFYILLPFWEKLTRND